MAVDFYLTLQRTYKWTPEEIDRQDLGFIFDEIALMLEQDDYENTEFIDDFM